MPKFGSREGDLYIDGRKVIKGYQSVTGWYWFAVEDAGIQDTVVNDQLIENDQIYYGLVQGEEEEWGNFSEGRLKGLEQQGWVRELSKDELPSAGRRSYRMDPLFGTKD